VCEECSEILSSKQKMICLYKNNFLSSISARAYHFFVLVTIFPDVLLCMCRWMCVSGGGSGGGGMRGTGGAERGMGKKKNIEKRKWNIIFIHSIVCSCGICVSTK